MATTACQPPWLPGPQSHVTTLRLPVVLGGEGGQLFCSDVTCCRRRADAASPKAPALPVPPLPTPLQVPDSRMCCDPKLVGVPWSTTRLKLCRAAGSTRALPHFYWPSLSPACHLACLAAEWLLVMAGARSGLSPPFHHLPRVHQHFYRAGGREGPEPTDSSCSSLKEQGDSSAVFARLSLNPSHQGEKPGLG